MVAAQQSRSRRTSAAKDRVYCGNAVQMLIERLVTLNYINAKSIKFNYENANHQAAVEKLYIDHSKN